MSNYPDDIGQYNWHPDSPFYEEPVDIEDDDYHFDHEELDDDVL